jgi:S-adenosylmethionine decarboxylase
MSRHAALGKHLLLDMHGVDAAKLTDAAALELALRSAAGAAGATVLFGHFHHFGPGQGVTGVLLLRESHISIHTWPEHGYAAVDVFMCGTADPDQAVAILKQGLAAQSTSVQAYARGAVLVDTRAPA